MPCAGGGGLLPLLGSALSDCVVVPWDGPGVIEIPNPTGDCHEAPSDLSEPGEAQPMPPCPQQNVDVAETLPHEAELQKGRRATPLRRLYDRLLGWGQSHLAKSLRYHQPPV